MSQTVAPDMDECIKRVCATIVAYRDRREPTGFVVGKTADRDIVGFMNELYLLIDRMAMRIKSAEEAGERAAAKSQRVIDALRGEEGLP